ncbi:MAG: methyltransferase domain-containing protein, partial [Myxococcales bacterium]|nr:methyltransferase domain-containing protein [Myxococcales bacterium]
DVVAAALDAVVAAFRSAPAPIRADQILALGYRPTDDVDREPLIATAIRGEAVIARAWAIGPVVGTAFESMRPAVRHAISRPRGNDPLLALRVGAESAAAAEELTYLGEAYVGWLQYAQSLWSRFDGVGANGDRRWRYRLARTKLPTDPATFERFVVERNPYLTRLPLPFDAASLEALLAAPRGEVEAFDPKPGTGINYVLTGPGRERPVFAPVSPRLSGLLTKLKAPKRLDALLAMREMGRELLEDALAREIVLVFEKPFFEMAEETDDPFELMLRAAEEELAVDEPVGAWQDERMAAAYEAFCGRSTLYHDVSRALVGALAPAADARVGELGVGTGVTSQAVLDRLGAEGRLVGVDPAPRMAARARELVPDGRAHFIVGAGRALAAAASREGAFDAIVASSSLWLSRSVRGELEALRRALRPGGRLAFSIPAEYVGDADHLATAEARAVAAALEAARAATGIAPPGAGDAHFGGDPALKSTTALRETLAAAGFDDVQVTPFRRPWPAAEYLDWLAMPAVIEGMVTEADKPRAGELVLAMRAAIPPETPLVTLWYLVTAAAR